MTTDIISLNSFRCVNSIYTAQTFQGWSVVSVIQYNMQRVYLCFYFLEDFTYVLVLTDDVIITVTVTILTSRQVERHRYQHNYMITLLHMHTLS